MDPNQTLANIRAITTDLNHFQQTDQEIWSLADELATMITDLDQWLSRGGFLPADWTQSAPCSVTPAR